MSEAHVHINRPSSTRFIARVRWPGCRKYTLLGKPTKSYPAAVARMAKAFASGSYKRGDVLVVADWYEPQQMCELVRT